MICNFYPPEKPGRFNMYDQHAANNLLMKCVLNFEDITTNLVGKYQDAVQDLFDHYTEFGWW